MPFLVGLAVSAAAVWTLVILAIEAARGNRVTLAAWAIGLAVLFVWVVAMGVLLQLPEFRFG
jgi:hypothetical protein